MTIRTLKHSDIAQLMEWHAKSGFQYEFPNFTSQAFEAIHVVVDDEDQPIVAAAAERILQLYLLCKPGVHPLIKQRGVNMLHGSLAEDLRGKGYSEVNAFLPPELADSFGKRLMKTWNWVKNWPSFCVRF